MSYKHKREVLVDFRNDMFPGLFVTNAPIPKLEFGKLRETFGSSTFSFHGNETLVGAGVGAVAKLAITHQTGFTIALRGGELWTTSVGRLEEAVYAMEPTRQQDVKKLNTLLDENNYVLLTCLRLTNLAYTFENTKHIDTDLQAALLARAADVGVAYRSLTKSSFVLTVTNESFFFSYIPWKPTKDVKRYMENRLKRAALIGKVGVIDRKLEIWQQAQGTAAQRIARIENLKRQLAKMSIEMDFDKEAIKSKIRELEKQNEVLAGNSRPTLESERASDMREVDLLDLERNQRGFHFFERVDAVKLWGRLEESPADSTGKPPP